MARRIVEAFPEQRLDPFTVARWSWLETAFYVEWLEDRAAEADRAETADMKRRLLEEMKVDQGSVGVDGLAGLGAQIREAS